MLICLQENNYLEYVEKKISFKIYILFLFFIFIVSILHNSLYFKNLKFTGISMGTKYNIKISTKIYKKKHKLETLLKKRLTELDNSLSTFNFNSEVSNFNSILNTKYKIYPSNDFFNLIIFSKKLYKIIGNVWDPSIGSIISVWGFGKDFNKFKIPKNKIITTLLPTVGFDKAIIFDNNHIRKGFKNSSLNFGSIAKGFGVDQITLLLHELEFKNFLIEIGGEIYAKGLKNNIKNWNIGIEFPDKNKELNKKYKSLFLLNKAVATSGNYRNNLKINNKKYSHIINPKTGYPSNNSVKSVSVVAKNCTVADGLSTALMVINPIKSINLINNLPSIECIIISYKKNFYKNHISTGIKSLKK